MPVAARVSQIPLDPPRKSVSPRWLSALRRRFSLEPVARPPRLARGDLLPFELLGRDRRLGGPPTPDPQPAPQRALEARGWALGHEAISG
jgi:hypothetical protein